MTIVMWAAAGVEFARRERPSHSDRSRSECDGEVESLP
jgi:hypothetical protein